MLDQQTKQQIQQNFTQFKTQFQQQWPDVTEQELQMVQTQPDQFITTVAQKTGQEPTQIEQQLKQVVQQTQR